MLQFSLHTVNMFDYRSYIQGEFPKIREYQLNAIHRLASWLAKAHEV